MGYFQRDVARKFSNMAHSENGNFEDIRILTSPSNWSIPFENWLVWAASFDKWKRLQAQDRIYGSYISHVNVIQDPENWTRNAKKYSNNHSNTLQRNIIELDSNRTHKLSWIYCAVLCVRNYVLFMKTTFSQKVIRSRRSNWLKFECWFKNNEFHQKRRMA